MKKLLLIFFLCLSVISLNAQSKSVYFEWTPSGRMLTIEGKSFQVVEYENQSKETIYNNLLVSISSIFNSPQHTISSVDNQLISINAIMPITWKVGGLLGKIKVDIHYVLKIFIKDNKVKVDAPYFTLLTFDTGGTQSNIESWTKSQGFFKSDGTPNSTKGRKDFCMNINEQFNNLINQILNNDVTEDW